MKIMMDMHKVTLVVLNKTIKNQVDHVLIESKHEKITIHLEIIES